MKIALIYICTGKYEMFFDTFFMSCEQNFYPNIKKEYFVFTDSKRIFDIKDEKIHPLYQAKSGWPFDTLLRYNWVCTIQDKLLSFDCCYFTNANSYFLRPIDENIIPFPSKNKPLVLWVHSKTYNDREGITFYPERNPISQAYIPVNSKCRNFGGGFWGGTSDAVIDMCRELRDRISKDLQNNYIAIWHDQSHLEKYGSEHNPYIIPNGIIASEQNADMSTIRMIFMDKNNFGGNDSLREVSFKQWMNNLPKKIYKFVLRISKKMGLEHLLHYIVDSIRKK